MVNRLYSAKFIVLELHSKTARVLGYNFMKSNDIIIHCGKTITNKPECIPQNGSTMNYEIEQNSIRLIKLKLSSISLPC